jgi:hypothetical protein
LNSLGPLGGNKRHSIGQLPVIQPRRISRFFIVTVSGQLNSADRGFRS